MAGKEELLEAEPPRMLSIPATLDASIMVYSQYTQTNGPASNSAASKNSNNGNVQTLNSSSVFFGGRVNEHIGFVAELNIYPLPAGLLNYKLPVIYEVGSAKVGAVVYSTSVHGPAFGFEVMNTGAVTHYLFNQFDQAATSAQMYINAAGPASGIDLVASNDLGYVVLGQWMPDQSGGAGTPTSYYARAAATPASLIPGFDFGVGFQYWDGTSGSTGNTPGTVGGGNNIPPPGNFIGNPVAATGVPQPVAGTFDTKAWAADAQLLGYAMGLPLTVIASYGYAPSSGAPTGPGGFQGNLFNPGTAARSSFNMGAELGVIPQRMTLQVGFRQANSGFAIGSTSNATDNAFLVGATFAYALNVRVDVSYSQYSGDMYNAASKGIQGAGYMGDSRTVVALIAGF